MPKKRLYADSFRSTNGLPKEKSCMISTHITVYPSHSIYPVPPHRARARTLASLPEPLTRNMYIAYPNW